MTRDLADRRAEMIASTQLGLITRAQVRRLRASEAWIDRRVRSGRWDRLHPGVYALVGSPTTWERMVLAAVLAGGPRAVASHQTAAMLHGFAHARRGRIHLTVTGTTPRRLPRVVVHRSLTLDAQDRGVVGSISVTSVARTLVDVAGTWSERQLGRAADQAMVLGTLDPDELHEVVGRLGPAPGRVISKIRRVAAARGPEMRRAASTPEGRVARLLADSGFRVAQQFRVVVGGEAFFLDAAIPDRRIAVEYFGFDPHRTRSAFGRDHRRARLLASTGWTVLVFTAEDSDAEIVGSVTALRRLTVGFRRYDDNRRPGAGA